MPLSAAELTPGFAPIKAVEHIRQFYDFITGAMTDQPFSPRNVTTMGGNQTTAQVVLTLLGVSGQTADALHHRLLSGDANPSWSFSRLGVLSWGPGGGSAVDTTLQRVSATILGVNGPLRSAQVGTPAAPGAGFGLLYFKTDNLPYFRAGAAGAETPLGATAGPDLLVLEAFL